MTSAILMHGLTKDYGSGHGLFDLDLEIAEGEVFGFLGPNGAGKTTTIRLLMGVIHPSAGTATVFGLDCDRDSVAVKREVGYLPGDLPQFGGMRGSEVVAYLGGMRGGIDAARVKGLAERLELDLGRRFREYSRGNKQKLGLVLAFMHRPKLLILDEPSSGLDPLNQQEFFKLVQESQAAGATAFPSSHVLSEGEHVCQRVGIIRRGKLVKVARLEDLHEMHVRRVEVEFAGDVQPQLFEHLPGIEDVKSKHHRITFIMRGSFEPIVDALAGHHVVNLTSHEPSLEEIFLTYYEDQPKEAAS